MPIVHLLACRFALALTGPAPEVAVVSIDASSWHARSLLMSVGHFVWEISADLLRAVWLTILFAPLAITAPFALNWDIRRQDWMELLRCVPAAKTAEGFRGAWEAL